MIRELVLPGAVPARALRVSLRLVSALPDDSATRKAAAARMIRPANNNVGRAAINKTL